MIGFSRAHRDPAMMRNIGGMIKRGLAEVKYAEWSKEELIKRIEQLENGVGSVESSRHTSSTQVHLKPDTSAPTPKKAKKQFAFHEQHQRFIAIKFAYLGWNYSGLAYQYEPTPLPTVEQCIVEALAKAKLIEKADPDCCGFSRCGRTDRGVSAMNQVISLRVRSQLSPEAQQKQTNDDKELPYMLILNLMLPTDIRVTAICLRPPKDFDARFLCLYRHYRYFFFSEGLDIDLMKQGAKFYEGVHDFRNFCKLDGSKQITNFMREVHGASICHLKDDIWYLDLKGLAFLWHQVRCMMAILFMVGQKLEEPSIVTAMLDILKYPARPVYEMANDIPLVLYNCHYPQMEWIESDLRAPKFYAQFRGMLSDYRLKLNMAKLMDEWYIGGLFQQNTTIHGGSVNVGDGCGRKFKKYTPLAERKVGETPDVVNQRYLERKARKEQAIDEPTV